MSVGWNGLHAGGLALLGALAVPAPARADALTICYNHGCNASAQVGYADAQLAPLQRQLAAAGDAAAEDWLAGKTPDGA